MTLTQEEKDNMKKDFEQLIDNLVKSIYYNERGFIKVTLEDIEKEYNKLLSLS
jgi:tRNA splicing endonuclease